MLPSLLTPQLWQWPALVVGAVTIAGVLLAPKLTKAVPATILGLLGGLIAYFGLGLLLPDLWHLAHNKLVIGPVGGGAGAVFAEFGARGSALAALRFADLRALAMPALTLSVRRYEILACES